MASSEAPRSTRLPLSRVKRLIGLDSDINQCSNPGAFLITHATELFIQHLATSAHTVVRSERKPRKNIAYKDLAAAVARNDQLEFLSDVVPKTVTFKEAKTKMGKPSAANGEENGGKQTKLGKGFQVVIEQKRNDEASASNGNGHSNGNGKQAEEGENSEDADPEAQLQNENESRRERLSLTNGDGILNGTPDEDGDVQMQ